MNRLLAPFLVLSVVVFGAGCISVEVVNKNAPATTTNPVAADQQAIVDQVVPTTTSEAPTTIDVTTTPVDSSSAPEAVVPVPADKGAELQLTVSRSPDGVLLSWNKRFSDTFAGYKVVRSETETNPSYPKDGALAFLPARASTTYKDASVKIGSTYYYRVCSIETDMPVACGNVVSVSVQ